MTNSKQTNSTPEIKTLFSTHVYKMKLLSPYTTLQKDLLSESVHLQENDEQGQEWSEKHYPNGFTSYASRDDLHYISATFRELEEKTRVHVYEYAKELAYDLEGISLVMTDCWLNIMRAGSVHTGHIHPKSFISGTYYVQTPLEASGIRFEDPRLTNFMACPPKSVSCSPEQANHFEITPEAGDLVLFESWLRHEVPPMTADGERISVSFNYTWQESADIERDLEGE